MIRREISMKKNDEKLLLLVKHAVLEKNLTVQELKSFVEDLEAFLVEEKIHESGRRSVEK